jgi:hypothetical protein
MYSTYRKIAMSIVAGSLVMGGTAYAASGDGIGFTAPDTLSSGGVVTGNGAAFKTKLVRMGNGLLVSAFGDSIDGSDAVAYDLKADDVHPVRDIFVRTCMPTDDNNHCESQEDWSPAVNISNTADKTSSSTKWTRDANGDLIDTKVAFPGDSEKPNIFNAGTTAVVTWTDKYCPGGEQRSVSYLEREGIEVPFSCVYVSYADLAVDPSDWNTTQITSGIRDAKQDVNKGVSHEGKAKWIITWQEDPQGLQIGGGDGPGEGASGASVAHGTDIWYATTNDINTLAFNTPARLTNNMTIPKEADHGDANPVYENNGTAALELESGVAGASRANTAVVNVTTSTAIPEETVPTVVVTYEETKGTGGLDDGKYVIYHSFPFDAPETNATGEIISQEDENARRVRFVTQVNPSPVAKMRMGIFWRQGNPTEGGPGDIMVRLGIAGPAASGLTPADMTPAVNISSNTVPWSPIGGAIEASTNDLNDTTDLNPYEDARAHRAVIRGDDFYIGYSYTKDWAIATYTDLDNYNFWMRRYDATTGTWTDANNLSNITDVSLNVKEPRLVGMPGNGPGCTDPANITNHENCQNKARLVIAWGMVSNGYEHIGDSEEFDIHYTRTNDKGETFEPITVVEGIGDNNRYESQLRPTPAGNFVFSVWNENDNEFGGTYSKVSISTPTTPVTLAPVDDVPVDEEPTDEEPTTEEPVVEPVEDVVVDIDDDTTATTTTTSSGGGGCTYNPNSNSFDMTFLMMMVLGLLYPIRRRFIS